MKKHRHYYSVHLIIGSRTQYNLCCKHKYHVSIRYFGVVRRTEYNLCCKHKYRVQWCGCAILDENEKGNTENSRTSTYTEAERDDRRDNQNHHKATAYFGFLEINLASNKQQHVPAARGGDLSPPELPNLPALPERDNDSADDPDPRL